jgi:hypothetical protein
MTRTTSITISCDDCAMQGTSVCEGCVVTYLCELEPCELQPCELEPGERQPCERQPADAVTIEADEVRAVRMLGRAGLTPPLRHRRRRALVS